MTPSDDPWHYARPELAEAYLQGFSLGLTSARGLFARRRMGKTQFLSRDMLPAARDAGYLTAYVNLWEDADHPGQAIAAALVGAVAARGVAKFWQSLNAPVKKLKGGGKVAPLGLEGSLEIDLADKEKLAVPAIQAALQAADKSKKKVLLIVDEAQVLTAPEHKGVARALRAGLDTRKAIVKVLFAGSSEAALRDMFSRASAPFFNWAPLEPFPLLGAEFVRAMVKQTAAVAKRPLAADAALAAFKALEETPEFFRRFLERYLMYQQQGVEEALVHTRATVSDEAGYGNLWKQLHRADRAVLLLAARGTQDFFSAATLQQLSTILGEPGVTPSTSRNALRRLTSPGRLVMAKLDHGVYRFEDVEFQNWVNRRKTLD
jgi:hypothetical protein